MTIRQNKKKEEESDWEGLAENKVESTIKDSVFVA
jgi:hypothetical protein